jgi:hypothetical protein
VNWVSDHVYSRDMARRTPHLPGPMHVVLATHLRDGFDQSRIEPILAALRQGSDMAQHVSPMAAAKKAYEKATSDGQWSRYRRMMDALLNKWGIYHLHAEGSRTLVFTYLHPATRTAYVLDIRPHDGDWAIERHLVAIAVREWPGAEIARPVGPGSSLLSEEMLLGERQRGTNMPVEVDGTFYLPRARALMMDGSGYDVADGILPVVHMARRAGGQPEGGERTRSPHFLMTGVDPNDLRPPWLVAVDTAATMAKERRRERALAATEAGVGPIAEAVRRVIWKTRAR